MFYIKRNTIELGPYDSVQIQSAYQSGNILKRDLIRHDKTDKFISVVQFLEMNNLIIEQEQERFGELFINVFRLQKVFVNPFKYLNSGFKENAIVYVLLAIVLIPILALFFSSIPLISYSIYGLYFASIWALILYKTIATKQVEMQMILMISLATIVTTIFVLSVFHLSPVWAYLERVIDSTFWLKSFLGMLFGVAIIEEILKQVFVYVAIVRNKEVTITRTAIFYGMIAGLSFGIFEGIEYQMTVNKTLETDHNYFYNIIRLTSLPFFHAIWAGIGAYFASLSFIEIRYKYSLRWLGVFIPASLHALYNSFGLNLLGLAIIVISAVLLTVYLTKSDLVGNKINNI